MKNKHNKDVKNPRGISLTLTLSIFFPTCKKDNKIQVVDEKGSCECPICEKARWSRRLIHNVGRVYRHTLRRCAAILYLAEAMGANWERYTSKGGDENILINPKWRPILDNEGKPQRKEDGAIFEGPDSKLFLEMVFGKTGRKMCYGMINYIKQQLEPANMYSQACHMVIDDILRAWNAKDPLVTKASRGWMVLNSVDRRPPIFANGGIPIFKDHIRLKNNRVQFKITKDEWLEAKFLRLDGERWNTLKKISTGEWKIGNPVRINFGDPKRKDGKLQASGIRLYVSYTRPKRCDKALSEKRCLEAAYTEDRKSFIKLKMRDGKETLADQIRSDSLSALGALDFVDKKGKIIDKYDDQRRSCGSPCDRRSGAGHQKAYRSISMRSKRASLARKNGCRTWNHTWTSRIINLAISWRCGRVEVYDLPTTLFERPWQWDDFKLKLKYKAKDKGIKVAWIQSPKINLG